MFLFILRQSDANIPLQVLHVAEPNKIKLQFLYLIYSIYIKLNNVHASQTNAISTVPSGHAAIP